MACIRMCGDRLNSQSVFTVKKIIVKQSTLFFKDFSCLGKYNFNVWTHNLLQGNTHSSNGLSFNVFKFHTGVWQRFVLLQYGTLLIDMS